MKFLNLPPFPVLNTLILCTESMQDQEKRSRLRALSSIMETSEKNYLDHGKKNSLYMLPRPHIQKELALEYASLYGNQFRRKGSPSRRVHYDVILSAPQNGKCPLCGERLASTLDHYLAQTHFPELVITPANLVPACKDCNYIKLHFNPQIAEQQTLHPYFDNLDAHKWLHARVNKTIPTSVQYYAEVVELPEIQQNRVRNHFELFKIAPLYISKAATELSGMYHTFKDLFDASGTDGLRSYLENLRDSWFRSDINCWQGVLFEALANSEWFCNGNFIEPAVNIDI